MSGSLGNVPAAPGDRVAIEWYPTGAVTNFAFDRIEFYVVEHGNGQLVANGTEPSQVYAHATGGAGHDLDDRGQTVVLTRPPVDTSAGEPEYDFPGTRLDLVWVFHVAPDQNVPENETARELFLRTMEMPGAGSFAVTDAAGVQAQPFFYAGEALLTLVALGLGGYALWPFSRPQDPDEKATETEALVGLVDRGETYLANLRNLLAITGVLLFFLGLFGSVALDDVLLLSIDPGAPTASWDTWMTRGFLFVWLALVATWLAMLGIVQRALSRWRSHARDRPLDL